MAFYKGSKGVVLVAVVLIASVAFLVGCGEDEADITRPQVNYTDQTFSLLVCDGNGNDPNGWGHDGAAVCTLDWNGDGSGPNRVPVTYVYDNYPIVDGVVNAADDKPIWDQTPWTTIKVSPIYGGGSQVKEVKVKAVFTYVNPPRIWFLFQWEDPTHTIDGKGTHHYYWLQKGGYTIPGDGFTDNRQYDAHEDWLALIFSTWFCYNTNNKGKPKENHEPADLTTSDWGLIETVPGFQAKGVEVLKSSGFVYKTPNVDTNNVNNPYGDKYYPGPYADMWFFSASRSNYTAEGGWTGTEPAQLIDCVISNTGFHEPEVGSSTNAKSLEEFLPVDSGISGVVANGGYRGTPQYMATADPTDNPPGATYLWSSSATAEEFSLTVPWPSEGGARVPGWLHRPALGSAGDVYGRCTFQMPNFKYYPQWPPFENAIGKDWCYTLEVSREIGTILKIDPREDALLGTFNPHPGQ